MSGLFSSLFSSTASSAGTGAVAGSAASSGGSSIFGTLFSGLLSGISASAGASKVKDTIAATSAATKDSGHQDRLTYQFKTELDRYAKGVENMEKYKAFGATTNQFSSLDRFAPTYDKTKFKGPTQYPGPSNKEY